MTEDAQWLTQFVEEGSELAFVCLVRKYVDLVYSAAMRQLKDAALAEDVTQLAFITLSQKAETVREECTVSAWLLVTTRYLCLSTFRANARRQRHEQTAAAMAKTTESPPSLAWEEFSPYLDAALGSLNRQDRQAITLRYFQGQSFREVARTMGTSPVAAKQRVHRATVRMRKFFAARGVNVSTATIGPAISAFAVHAAPPHLAACALSAGLAAKTGIATSVSIKGAAILMGSAKTKILAAAIGILVVGGAVATWRAVSPPRHQVIVIAPARPAALVPPADWLQAFNTKYGLSEGQMVRLVQLPYGPERQAYWDSEQRRNNQPSFPLQNMAAYFVWDGRSAHWATLGGSGSVEQALRVCAHLKAYEIDRSCLAYQLGGDWVARKNATTEEILAGIAAVISQKAGHPVHFVRRLVQCETIVVKGSFVPTAKLTGGVVRLIRNPAGKANVERSDLRGLLNVLEDLTSKRIYNESDCPSTTPISWRDDLMSGDDSAHLLQTISSQTSLHFDIEPREIMVWVLENGPAPTTIPAA